MSERLVFLALAATMIAPGPAAAQTLPGTAEQREACMADVKANCRFVVPGGGRMVACMSEKFASLSPGCQTTILEAACGPDTDPRLAGRFPCNDTGAPPPAADDG